MRISYLCFLVILATFTLGESKVNHEIETRRMEIEERSVMDQLSALVRLPGDIMRKDIVAFGLDVIIISRFLPLPWILVTAINVLYKVLKFIHPAYWWLFPSTKPPNVEGYGFAKLFS